MNYRQTMEYIESLSRYGSVLGLANMERLCAALERPEERLRVIHVAGTNGKGSTVAYISSILKAAGYRVGTYTSPAVNDYRERFCVNQRMISQKALCEYMERLKGVCGDLVAQGFPHPTVFEVETALAFLYFQEKNCDYAVVEVGLGGATDATNVIRHPIACVWTSISMDHMAILGKTLKEIAAVKAGIARPGAVYVTARQEPEALEQLQRAVEEAQKAAIEAVTEPPAGSAGAFQQRAVEDIRQQTTEHRYMESGLVVADDAQAKILSENLATTQFRYREFPKLKIHLPGRHQVTNAVLAVECICQLRERGLVAVSDAAVLKGLDEARWPGRLEVIGHNPLFVLDGAHNEDAAKRLAQNIEIYFTNKRIIYIMGVLKDKEYEKMLRITAGYADHILTVTPPDNPRALPALELAQVARECHPRVTNTASLEEAVELSHLLAEKEDVILCFGSLSWLGGMRRVYEDFRKHRR
ncbi:MAG: bifunctional folylpolyglutamate synthase/dihydrofolate synthase [Lachnospiraceae bacterium]|nr:bifunctional folylpolyglutamate synthase/dihydrofolate synthase [Lachnospiraceae bacterium]